MYCITSYVPIHVNFMFKKAAVSIIHFILMKKRTYQNPFVVRIEFLKSIPLYVESALLQSADHLCMYIVLLLINECLDASPTTPDHRNENIKEITKLIYTMEAEKIVTAIRKVYHRFFFLADYGLQ